MADERREFKPFTGPWSRSAPPLRLTHYTGWPRDKDGKFVRPIPAAPSVRAAVGVPVAPAEGCQE